MSVRHPADETSCKSCVPPAFKVASLVAVGIDVSHRVLLQFSHMRLHPLHRTQQPRLFSIPRAINNGALRRPTLLVQFAQHARLFQHFGLAGNWILRAIHPCIDDDCRELPTAPRRRRHVAFQSRRKSFSCPNSTQLSNALSRAPGQRDKSSPARHANLCGATGPLARKAAAARRHKKSAALEFS